MDDNDGLDGFYGINPLGLLAMAKWNRIGIIIWNNSKKLNRFMSFNTCDGI